MFKRLALLILLCAAAFLREASAHVPHDIIYSFGVSPDYAEDGLIFSSSTQFGESHLVSHNRGETFAESNTGMLRTLVTSHTISPNFTTDGTVYLATEEGYYKSTDRGGEWGKQPLFADEAVLSIALSADAERLFILTATGIHLVASDGATHQTLQERTPIKLGKIKILNDTLYLHRVSYEDVAKKNGMDIVHYAMGSMDTMNLETKAWSRLAGPFEKAVIADFDINAAAIVATTIDGHIHLSADQGVTWKDCYQHEGDFACKIAFSPNYANDHTIAAAMAKGYVNLSTDGGAEWTLKSNGLSRCVHHVNIHVNELQFSPDYANDQTIFLSKTTGFYKTTDNGKFWRHNNVWNPKWGYFVYPAPNKDSIDVFTATYNSGIARSHDGGKNWKNVLNQIQFLPKVPFLTFKDPDGHELPLNLDLPEIQRYDAYDPIASPEILRPARRWLQKIASPNAYLGSYCEFTGDAGYTVEVFFYGTGIDLKTITGPDLGIVDLFLDDQSADQFDFYSPAETFDVSGFKKDDLPLGFHTLRILATGSKNAASTGTGMTFNAANNGRGEKSTAVSQACKDLGFNAYGYGCPNELKPDMPYLEGANHLVPISTYRTDGSFHFVDIFDPKVQASLEAQIKLHCIQNRENTNLIGYCWTDLAAWPLENSTGKNWVDFIRELPAGTPGKSAYEKFLATWKGEDPTKRDTEFLRLNAHEYFGVLGEANRKFDPDHLIFGDRLSFPTLDPVVVEEMLPYVDAIAIQPQYLPGFPKADRLLARSSS